MEISALSHDYVLDDDDDSVCTLCGEVLEKKGFEDKGYDFMCESATNQQFPILSYEQIERLKGEFSFDDYGPADENHRYVRFCTSWATTEENVDKLLAAI